MFNPMTACDFYKVSHYFQYPKGTTKVYSNFTARSAKNFKWDEFDNKVVFFGLSMAISKITYAFQCDFFNMPLDMVLEDYTRRMDSSLGKGAVTTKHIAELHELGRLPILVKSLPEGTPVPIGVPMFTIENTEPEFFWVTNYLESWLSAEVWKACTSATIARQYYKLVKRYCEETGGDVGFLPWQCHDFSFRGMSCIEDAQKSGAGHLIYFNGTDTIPAIDFIEEFYPTNDFIGGSVSATEHSVMSMGSKESELETYERLIMEVYPKGIISIVSDTWDFFKVLTEYTVQLRDKILAREGKVVFRPDSGVPEDILCGDKNAAEGSPERKGAVQILWEVFGGTVNEKGFKVLDPHVGLIYGDSITLERAREILKRLKDAGFVSTTVVFGVGSFTYEYVTRDTFGFALKSTYGELNGEPREIFKNPKTDDGTKKSLVGLLKVVEENGELVVLDRQKDTDGSLLVDMWRPIDFASIREKAKKDC